LKNSLISSPKNLNYNGNFTPGNPHLYKGANDENTDSMADKQKLKRTKRSLEYLSVAGASDGATPLI